MLLLATVRTLGPIIPFWYSSMLRNNLTSAHHCRHMAEEKFIWPAGELTGNSLEWTWMREQA
jgi:hypothetical protein